MPGQTAAGLIQMIDATARQYAGVSADTLATWDELQQLPSIVDYYDVGRPLSGADFRLIGYSRGARLTAPDDAYLYAPSSGAGHVNEGVSDGSGGITYGAVRSEWRVGVENKKAAWGRYEVPRLPVSTGAGLIPLLLLAAWVAWKRGI